MNTVSASVTCVFRRHRLRRIEWWIPVRTALPSMGCRGHIVSKSLVGARYCSSKFCNSSSKQIQIISVPKSSHTNNTAIRLREDRYRKFTRQILNGYRAEKIPSATHQEIFNSIEFWISVVKHERNDESSSGSVTVMVDAVTKADQLLRLLTATGSKENYNYRSNFVSIFKLTNAIQSVLDNWRFIVLHTPSIDKTKQMAANAAHSLLELVVQDSRINRAISVKCYNTVLDSFAKAGQAERAEALLQLMIIRSNENNNCAPDTVSYNTCISAWSHAAKFISCDNQPQNSQRFLVKAAQASEEWLRKMEADTNPNVVPNTISYTTVMDAWSRAAAAAAASSTSGNITETPMSRKATPQYVQQLLDEMRHAYESGKNPNVKPNATTYGTVISAWAQCSSGIQKAAQNAESLLKQMETIFEQTSDSDIRPTIMHYNMVLHALSNDKRPDSARRAERILFQLEKKWSNDETSAPQPDLLSYNTVLNAYAKSREPGSAQRAELLLEAMIAQFETQGRKHLKPDTVSFTAVIDAMSKDNSGSHQAIKAEALLWRMLSFRDSSIKPNEKTFTSVIHAYARDASVESSRRAELLLKRMSQEANVEPNICTYNAVLDTFAKCGLAEKAEELLHKIILERKVQVDRLSFTACIESWATKQVPVSADKAEALLKQMHNLYKQGGYDGVQPDLITYNTTLHAICNSRVANSGHRAQALLHQMLSTSELPSPDTVSYNTVIMAWSRSSGDFSSAENAEKLLRMMCQRHQTSSGPKPDVISFNATINCWARSQRPDKAQRAIQLLDQMKDPSSEFGHLQIQPDLITYNSVLNACATTTSSGDEKDKSAILMYTMDLLADLEGSTTQVRPDCVSYTTALKACCNRNLSATHLAVSIFERCCNAGQVSSSVLQYFKMSDFKSYEQMIGKRTLNDLPKHWTRNVRSNRKRWR